MAKIAVNLRAQIFMLSWYLGEDSVCQCVQGSSSSESMDLNFCTSGLSMTSETGGGEVVGRHFPPRCICERK